MATIEQRLNVVKHKLKDHFAWDNAVYREIQGCLTPDTAHDVLAILKPYTERVTEDSRWSVLLARAYLLAGAPDAENRVFQLILQTQVEETARDKELLSELQRIAKEKEDEKLAFLWGEEDKTSKEDRTGRVVNAIYLKNILNEEGPIAIRAFREKRRVEERGIRKGLGADSIKSNRYIRFLKYYSSFTPIMKGQDDRRLGGGYFVKMGDYKIVIDPGHHFLLNFFDANLRIGDIDAVIVTHFHDDHYADFAPLLSLVYRHWKDDPTHQVDVFLDETCAETFRPILEASMGKYVRLKQTLTPGHMINIGRAEDEIQLNPLPTFHEVFGKQGTGVGLSLRSTFNNETHTLLITGDTGWDESLETVYREERDASKSLVLVLHLSSVDQDEIPNPFLAGSAVPHNRNHLCMYGMCKAIEACQPNAAVLSEIGEELAPILPDICRLVREVYGVACFIGQIKKNGELIHLGKVEYRE